MYHHVCQLGESDSFIHNGCPPRCTAHNAAIQLMQHCEVERVDKNHKKINEL